MIAIVDYGVANLGSMRNMLRRIGTEAQLAAAPETILAADKLILPGIGAFDHGMSELAARGLDEPIRQRVLRDRKPILGVCLGMQLLGRGSEEGNRPGLGLIDAHCEKLRAGAELRVPHMGWNHLRPQRPSALLAELDAQSRFYFVHSYHLVCERPQDVLATAVYGIEFTAMIQRDNIHGAQFHPEKSHRYGMRMLQNFVEL
jgi:imidazole glycerol-phosphate synthase subunit HisH